MSDPGSLALLAYGCDLVGVIFLANALSLRNPRRFIQEHFGVEPRQPLRAVHHQIKVKAQIFTGFLFLMLGFTVGFVSTLVEPAEAGPALEPLRAILALVAGVLAVALGLRVAHNMWALAVFRKLLAEFFDEHADWEFEKHPATTREIGDILGVAHHGDDSISEYAERVRQSLGLQGHGRVRGAASAGVGDDAFAPLRNVGGDRRR